MDILHLSSSGSSLSSLPNIISLKEKMTTIFEEHRVKLLSCLNAEILIKFYQKFVYWILTRNKINQVCCCPMFFVLLPSLHWRRKIHLNPSLSTEEKPSILFFVKKVLLTLFMICPNLKSWTLSFFFLMSACIIFNLSFVWGREGKECRHYC